MKPLLTMSVLLALAAVPGPARAQIKVTHLDVNTEADEDDPHGAGISGEVSAGRWQDSA